MTGDEPKKSALKGIQIHQLTPEYWEKRRQELSERFPGALLGWIPDSKPAVFEELQAVLQDGREEAIQAVLTKRPYLFQYALERSGHHGTWVFPKLRIKQRSAAGIQGLIPDFLVVTKSSLGYFWHIFEIKRFDQQFANRKGDGLSPEGNKAVVQSNSYLNHFQDYIDAVRSGIGIPDLVQPEGVVLLMGDSEAETDAQQKCRSDFVRNNPKIDVVSYRRILAGLASDLSHRAKS